MNVQGVIKLFFQNFAEKHSASFSHRIVAGFQVKLL